MEVVVCNPEILNTASSTTKKQDNSARLLQTDLMKGLMASCSAYNQIYSMTQQDSFSKKDLKRQKNVCKYLHNQVLKFFFKFSSKVSIVRQFHELLFNESTICF